MRYLVLLAAGLVVAKKLPIIAAAVMRAASDASERFDAVYGEAARRAGQAAERFADQRAEREHAKAKTQTSSEVEQHEHH